MIIAALFFVLAAVTVFFLWRERLIRNFFDLAICLTIIVLVFDARLYFMPYETLDYKDFLKPWIEFYSLNGGFQALKFPVGNYNVPYLYFMALFSYIPFSGLYLIKLLSITFDIILAFSAMKLVSLFTDNRIKKLGAFFAILFLPSVVLNGSCWGQCDSIYAAFSLLSVYFALKDRPSLSIVMLALSFGFKLQAVFIMPLFLPLLIAKKIKIRHLFIFPLTYSLLVLPAVAAGRPFIDTIMLYFNQIDTVGGGLNYNSSSVYSFFPSSASHAASTAGIISAFLFIAILCVFCYLKRDRLTNEALFTLSLIFSISVPFFLPHMHDRYFFIADILSVSYAAVKIKRLPMPLLVSFASLLGYYAYLRKRYLMPMSFGAASLIVVLVILLFDFYTLLKDNNI